MSFYILSLVCFDNITQLLVQEPSLVIQSYNRSLRYLYLLEHRLLFLPTCEIYVNWEQKNIVGRLTEKGNMKEGCSSQLSDLVKSLSLSHWCLKRIIGPLFKDLLTNMLIRLLNLPAIYLDLVSPLFTWRLTCPSISVLLVIVAEQMIQW